MMLVMCIISYLESWVCNEKRDAMVGVYFLGVCFCAGSLNKNVQRDNYLPSNNFSLNVV